MVATQEVQNYLDELWFFLDNFDHSLKQKKLEDLRQRCRSLFERLPALPSDDRLKERYDAMRLRMAELRTALEDYEVQSHAYLQQRQLELSRSYEYCTAGWREWKVKHGFDAPRVKGLRPLRHARTLFHAFMAVVAVGCYQFLLSRTGAVIVLASLLSVFGSLEIARRFSPTFNRNLLELPLFKSIARPHEFHRVNSATYYLIALILVTPFFSRPEVITGILILGFADPAAAWLGKGYGKRKIYGSKTVVGFIAFVVTGFVLSASWLLAFYPDLPIEQRLLGTFAAAFIAGLVELLVTRIDDNLAIPLAAVSAAALFF